MFYFIQAPRSGWHQYLVWCPTGKEKNVELHDDVWKIHGFCTNETLIDLICASNSNQYFVQGVAKNKKLGKQLAAQKILQQIHPEVRSRIFSVFAFVTSVVVFKSGLRKWLWLPFLLGDCSLVIPILYAGTNCIPVVMRGRQALFRATFHVLGLLIWLCVCSALLFGIRLSAEAGRCGLNRLILGWNWLKSTVHRWHMNGLNGNGKNRRFSIWNRKGTMQKMRRQNHQG